jgi:hypothetical protein
MTTIRIRPSSASSGRLRNTFKLRAGDVIPFDGRLCRVIRVNECAAVVIMNQRVREFKTRFDKPVRFQPPPKLFRISPHSAVPVFNRKTTR